MLVVGPHNSTVQDREMPPFTSPQVNPFFSITGLNPTQAFGLNYRDNLCYSYDRLVFDGLTPAEFLGSNQCGARQLATIVTRDRNIFTLQGRISDVPEMEQNTEKSVSVCPQIIINWSLHPGKIVQTTTVMWSTGVSGHKL